MTDTLPAQDWLVYARPRARAGRNEVSSDIIKHGETGNTRLTANVRLDRGEILRNLVVIRHFISYLVEKTLTQKRITSVDQFSLLSINQDIKKW